MENNEDDVIASASKWANQNLIQPHTGVPIWKSMFSKVTCNYSRWQIHWSNSRRNQKLSKIENEILRSTSREWAHFLPPLTFLKVPQMRLTTPHDNSWHLNCGLMTPRYGFTFALHPCSSMFVYVNPRVSMCIHEFYRWPYKPITRKSNVREWKMLEWLHQLI